MINLVRHDKKLNNALPTKRNLQHVKRQNVIPTPSYTTTNMGDNGIAYVESDLQWLWYVQATIADREFTNDWCRRIEEILILIGSMKIEEPSPEMRRKNGNKGEKRAPKSRKPKGAIETLLKK